MKKYTTLLFSIVFALPIISMAQSTELIWAHKHGGFSNDKINASALGFNETLYSTGHYNGVVDFDPGDGSYELDNTAHIFIQKLNHAGDLVWVKSLNESGTPSPGSWYVSEGNGIDTDSEDNVIVCGSFDTETDFDPGAEVYNLSTNGSTDIFVLKMNTDGEFIWSFSIGGANADNAIAVTTDNEDNIYVTGTFNDVVDFDPDPDNEIILDANLYTATWASAATFILKLDPDGNVLWAHGIANDNKGGLPHDIVSDSENNVMITGYFTGLTDFGHGDEAGLYTGSHDCYLLKLDSESNFLWLQVLESTGFNIGYAIDVDPDDNIYHCGQYGSSVDFDQSDDEFIMTAEGYYDSFVQKLDPDGELIWAKSIGGSSAVYAYDIAIDTHGEHDVFLTGTFGGTVDFDPNETEYILSASITEDFWMQNIFIEKLNPDGGFTWAEKIDDSDSSTSTTIFPTSDGGVVISGQFVGSPDFDPSDNEFTLTTSGGTDAFMAKYLYCLSESFGLSENNLPEIVAECDVNELPLPTAMNGCGLYFQGTPNISFPITEEGEYIINWTYENSDGQILNQNQQLTIAYTNTAVEHIEDHLTAVESAYSYQWVDCDNDNSPVLGATEQDFYPGLWGNFAVEITNEDGCVHTSECLNYFGVGLSENQFDTEINIYPNPTTGHITLDFNHYYDQLKIRVIDILGNEVTQKGVKQINKTDFYIDAAKGWYFIEIENEFGELVRTKLLKY